MIVAGFSDLVPPQEKRDLAITCGGRMTEPSVPEPKAVVEVLSPSTAATDYLRKLPDYRRISSSRTSSWCLAPSLGSSIGGARRMAGWFETSATTAPSVCRGSRSRSPRRAVRGSPDGRGGAAGGRLSAQPRPWGSFQSMIGPLGTMPVGFTLSWLP